MNITFLSGKGGTGKTTISTNFAYLNAFNYYDCDVEEPNGGIFFKPNFIKEINAEVLNPIIDDNECTLCNACVENCQFGTLANTKDKILVFNELCHGCGTCKLSCPVHAVGEENRSIGVIKIGKYVNGRFGQGLLNLREPLSVPVITQLKALIPAEEVNVLDAPPGSSCTVVETLDNSDFAVIVTEPSLFGLRDLKSVVEITEEMNIPYGVVINRGTKENDVITNYLNKKGITLLGVLPLNRRIAKLYSRGELFINTLLEEKSFHKINENILKQVGLWRK